RLIAFPEGALQAFNDEVLDLDHATFARECAIDIPGEETETLGKIAKEYNAFIMAQAKAKHPDLKDRYFNVGFIINPRGRVILKHYKVSPLFPVEHSVCPHDVYDWWVEKYGKTLDAFWPVADTEIGRLGIMMANEGSYPENARALALNGAVGQLDEGPEDRALPDPLREADLPEGPLPQARPDEARGVPREGHPAADPTDARSRHLEAALAMITRLLVLTLWLIPLTAAAEMRLPPGFTAQVYVTGEGFDTDTSRGIRGIPATSTLAFDRSGLLYLARTGRRYVG